MGELRRLNGELGFKIGWFRQRGSGGGDDDDDDDVALKTSFVAQRVPKCGACRAQEGPVDAPEGAEGGEKRG